MHRIWLVLQGLVALIPVVGLANKMLHFATDGAGRDLFKTLLPRGAAPNYEAFLAGAALLVLLSEILRRRFTQRHRDLLEW